MRTYYKCTDCKERFYESEIDKRSYRESYECFGSPYSQEVEEWYCPFCGSDDIEECYGDINEKDEDEYDDYDEEEEDVAMIIAEEE